MEEIPFTRVYLESLATGDLIRIANELSLDIPDNPDRAFVIGEILDASLKDEDSFNALHEEQEITDPVLVEATPLSKQYNISFIEVMIRDPLWAFVFWEIKASDEDQSERAYDSNGYYLKISPLENPNSPSRGEGDGVFTIPVKKEDRARYLGLTNTVGDGASLAEQCQYKVEICFSVGCVETVLAVSNPVRLPGQPLLALENQLMRLSGYGDIKVIRKSERTHRTKGAGSSNE